MSTIRVRLYLLERLILTTFLTWCVCGVGPGYASLTGEVPFLTIIQQQQGKIIAIDNDEQALSFFLTDRNFIRQLFSGSSPAEVKSWVQADNQYKEAILGFVKHAAVWHFANRLEVDLENYPGSIEEEPPQTLHQQWLGQTAANPLWLQTREFLNIFLQLSDLADPSISQDPPPGFGSFGEYFDRTYPHYFLGQKQSWSQLALTQGPGGILARLKEYPDSPQQETSNPQGTNQAINVLGRHYLTVRLIPLLKAQLLALVISLKTHTEWSLLEDWRTLTNKKEDLQNARSLQRLCGTWQWLIHNHLNHQDHKTVMIYPPPSQFDRMEPRPATIHVQGDTVYIRWEFPNGIIQEESLLLSEKDRILTGTFVNSLGPHGNISGRRIAPCQKP